MNCLDRLLPPFYQRLATFWKEFWKTLKSL